MKSTLLFSIAGILVSTVIPTWASGQAHRPRVLVLVTNVGKFPDGRSTGLWLEEFAVPYVALASAGAEITVVSPKGGPVPIDPHSQGSPEQLQKWADAERALRSTIPLADSVRAAGYDAIFIPGGHGPLFDLANDAGVARLISEFARAGKPVASVCHGPAALVAATLGDGSPLVQGKRFTAFSDSEEKAAGLQDAVPFSVQRRLTELGGHYSQATNFSEYAVADGILITGQNPASSEKVAQLLLKELATRGQAEAGK